MDGMFPGLMIFADPGSSDPESRSTRGGAPAERTGFSFSIDEPVSVMSPVVFASPHSGRLYPKGFLETCKASMMELRRIEDAYVDRLLAEGFEVVGLDNLMTGDLGNLADAGRSRHFHLEIGDVREPLENFSTAIQQMVAIARAVSFDARLVIMDEPTSSLDEAEVSVLLRTILQLKSEGVAVIFVSHKLDELYKVCDRVTIMRDGRTVMVSPMKDISKLQLVASMLGRDLAEVKKKGATAFDGVAGKVGGELLTADHVAVGHRVRDASLDIRRGEIVGLAPGHDIERVLKARTSAALHGDAEHRSFSLAG